MPRVPTYDNFQAAPNAIPQVGFAAPAAPDVGARQTQQLGESLQSLGGDMGRIALDAQAQANQARLDEFQNSAVQARTDLAVEALQTQGRAALDRPNGQSLASEYTQKLNDRLADLSSGLGNDAQRQAASHISAQLNQQFYGLLSNHAAQQQKAYEQQQDVDTVSTATQQGVALWGIPSMLDQSRGAIQAVLDKTIAKNGWTADKDAAIISATKQKLFSPLYSGVVTSMLQAGKVKEAADYLSANAQDLDVGSLVKLNKMVTETGDAYIGQTVGTSVVNRNPARVDEAGRAFNIAIGTESGGRQFAADGTPLTSPKGAIGIAQIMPSTAPEAAKLAGLPWDENRYRTDPDYNRALGAAYFQKQLQDNGGDLAKAYAAYNAGPGALQTAIKKADQSAKMAASDPAVQPHQWLDFLPKETQDYVTKNMKAYDAGAGQPQRPTFADIDAQLRANPMIANNPARYKVAREAALQQYTEQTEALKQQDDQGVANAMRGVMQNGGRWTDLPPDVRAAVPPDKIDNVINFAQKISKGDDTTSLWLYNKLTNDPAYLRGLSDDQFFALRRELSESDFKHFSDARAKLTGATPGSNGPGDLNNPAIKQALDSRMRVLGIDPTPKDDGGADAARIGAIRQFVDNYFYGAQREAGKKFTDGEVSQHIDALFAKNATFRGWFTNSSGAMLGMKVGDIDGATKDNIKAAFKRQGVDSPTDAQILNAYWNMRVTRR